MRYLAVIDTNVLVSALLAKHSDSATVILTEKMLRGEAIWLYSDDILREYREVLCRKKFGFDFRLIDRLLKAIEYYGIRIDPAATGETLADMKDLPFYEVVSEKKEDGAYLVTGNLKHFPVRPYIVTARQMLDILAASPTPD